MGRVLFFGFPAHGHTNPTLALVKELVNRGEQVIYYSFDEFKDKIEKTGAEFKSYGLDASSYANTNSGNLPKLFRILMEAGYLVLGRIYPDIMKDPPDYIIHDSFCCWAKYIAASLGIPAVSSITIFTVSKKSVRLSKEAFTMAGAFILGLKDLNKGLSVQKKIAKEYNIQKYGLVDAFINKEKLNIVYTSREFQPNGNLFDESFKFVGPSIADRQENTKTLVPESNTLPVIYISLGTVVNQNAGFYTMCFQALADANALIVMSVGSKTDLSSIPDPPPNFIVRNFVAQLDILSQSACFITHGGMNSVHEGLYYGVPLIVVPQTGEQRDVAARVEAANAGLFLRTVTPQSLKEAVTEVLRNGSFEANAQRMGDSFRSAGGYKKAADEILQYARSTKSMPE